ncbi:hypothetical protein QQ045_012643 [Rhodiola kirilowii]
MEGRRAAKLAQHHTFLAAVLIVFILLHPSESTVFTVGEDEKWSTGVNYLTWSQKYNFTVGDTLEFEYLKGEHNVYDVTEEAYRSCNETDGVYARYQSGNDTVELRKSSKYWFICNIPGHCFSGMRLKIDVYKASSITSPLPPPPPPSPASNHSNKNWTLPLSTSFITALLMLNLFS